MAPLRAPAAWPAPFRGLEADAAAEAAPGRVVDGSRLGLGVRDWEQEL